MQDIFVDNTAEPSRNKFSYKAKRDLDIFDYFVNKHVDKFGDEVKVYYSNENKMKIRDHVEKEDIPLHHYLAYVFSEMPGFPVWTNVLLGKAWKERFNDYLATLKVGIPLEELQSPLSLKCYSELLTFNRCCESSAQDGISLKNVIKNFLHRGNLSTHVLNYIYKTSGIKDEVIDDYLSNYEKGLVLPFEDVFNDIQKLAQYEYERHHHQTPASDPFRFD
jgi:hypothetical protein